MSYAESMIKKYRDTENKSVGLYSAVLNSKRRKFKGCIRRRKSG